MGKFNRYCYLCPNKGIKGCKISFHKFPSNEHLCLKWKRICKLRIEDNVTSLLICSEHFSPNDFTPFDLERIRLKSTAIPSLPKRANASVSGENVEEIESTLTVEQIASERITNESTIKEEPQCVDLCMLNSIDVSAPTSNATCIQLNGNIVDVPIPTSCAKYIPPPRCVGQMNKTKIKSLQRKQLINCLNIAIETAQRKGKQVKILQQTVRRLTKKIQSLKDLVKHLRKTDLSEESGSGSST